MWTWLDQLGKKGPTEDLMPPREKPNSKHEPTSHQEPIPDKKPTSRLEGTVLEGRPDETIAEDGTITLKFESLEIAAKWLWQEDRRRKGLPIATTTKKPTTTTTQEPTTSTTTTNVWWNHSGNVAVNHWVW